MRQSLYTRGELIVRCALLVGVLVFFGAVNVMAVGGVLTPAAMSIDTAWGIVADRYNGITNVKDGAYAGGATGNGSTDDTAAFVAAIAAAAAGPKPLHIPQGVYKITSQLTVATSNIRIFGDGRLESVISFQPTGAATLWKFTAGASIIARGVIENISLYSPETTFTKVAMDFLDVSEFRIRDVNIYGVSNYWSGNGSIGIRTNGRENTSFVGVTSYADKPLVIAVNPNSTISIDQFHFQDMYFATTASFPLITIDTGVNLSRVSFDGFQSWVGGTHGLYWLDTTSSQTSFALEINNVGLEQGVDLTNGQYIYISHNTGMQRLSIRNFNGDNRKGFYFRKCQAVLLDTIAYTSTTKEGLNIDSTVAEIEGINTYWQAGSTATITGQILALASTKYPSTGALPPDFHYTLATNDTATITLGRAIGQPSFTLANNAVGALTPAAGVGNPTMVVVISTNDTANAIVALNGNQTVSIISDPSAFFSNTATTAAKTNIYYDAGNTRYSIENKRGGSRNYIVTMMGSYFNP